MAELVKSLELALLELPLLYQVRKRWRRVSELSQQVICLSTWAENEYLSKKHGQGSHHRCQPRHWT